MISAGRVKPGGRLTLRKPVSRLITDLLDGQYNDPVQVIVFNTSEGWSRDVSEEVARGLRQRCADQDRDLPLSLEPFVDRLAGGEVQSGNRPRQT
jgi:hypothetical protein